MRRGSGGGRGDGGGGDDWSVILVIVIFSLLFAYACITGLMWLSPYPEESITLIQVLVKQWHWLTSLRVY